MGSTTAKVLSYAPCVTRGSHSFTCHPHTYHTYLYSPAARHHRPLAGTHCAYPRRDGQAELTWVNRWLAAVCSSSCCAYRFLSSSMRLSRMHDAKKVNKPFSVRAVTLIISSSQPGFCGFCQVLLLCISWLTCIVIQLTQNFVDKWYQYNCVIFPFNAQTCPQIIVYQLL